jgi:hypothetical protein
VNNKDISNSIVDSKNSIVGTNGVLESRIDNNNNGNLSIIANGNDNQKFEY